MSLSKLPEELVAQMASHLDYEDLCNFMESSSRNYHVVRRYRMDKIKLDCLDFEMLTNGTIRYSAFVSRKKYTFKAFNLHEQPIAMIRKMLEQVSSIDALDLEYIKITKDLVQMLMATITKIGSLCFFENETVELPVAEFIELCQRFDISLINAELERSFWADERMSLSKLPDELVAQVASHLDYEDVCNFMESSWRNYHVVKKYRMDKIKLDKLHFEILTNVTIEYSAFVGSKKHTFKAFNLHEQPIIIVKKMLEQVSSIDVFYIWSMKITKDFVQMLKETRTKISFLSFTFGSINLSKAEFINFCERFNISLDTVDLEDSFWTDEVLCQILSRTQIYSCEVKNCTNKITDRTLDALTGGYKIQRIRLDLNWFRTSFTIKGILKAFEKVREKKFEELDWHFGILHSNQFADAVRYFENGDFGQYQVNMWEDVAWNYRNYTITKRQEENSDVPDFWISFVIEKP